MKVKKGIVSFIVFYLFLIVVFFGINIIINETMGYKEIKEDIKQTKVSKFIANNRSQVILVKKPSIISLEDNDKYIDNLKNIYGEDSIYIIKDLNDYDKLNTYNVYIRKYEKARVINDKITIKTNNIQRDVRRISEINNINTLAKNSFLNKITEIKDILSIVIISWIPFILSGIYVIIKRGGY